MNYRQVTVHPESRIAPNATLVGQVEVAKDATILFNATLRGDYGSRIVVGEGSNVQENSCLHLDFNQDCIVGRGVTIGHGAVVHGCTLGDNVLVGMGAVVMNGAVIGANSLVAASALVTEGTQVPEGSLVVGVPGEGAPPAHPGGDRGQPRGGPGLCRHWTRLGRTGHPLLGRRHSRRRAHHRARAGLAGRSSEPHQPRTVSKEEHFSHFGQNTLRVNRSIELYPVSMLSQASFSKSR